MQNHWLFSFIFISVSGKKLMRKKSKEDEQNLEEWNSARRRSQAKCQLVQTSYIKRIKLFLFLPYNKHLINRGKSVCMGESWPWSYVQTSLRSFCTYELGQDSPIQTFGSVKQRELWIAWELEIRRRNLHAAYLEISVLLQYLFHSWISIILVISPLRFITA